MKNAGRTAAGTPIAGTSDAIAFVPDRLPPVVSLSSRFRSQFAFLGVGVRPIGVCPASLFLSCHGSPRDKVWRQRPDTRRPRTRIPAVPRSGTTIFMLSAGAFAVCGHGCPHQLVAAGNQAKPALRSRTSSLASLVTGQCRRRPAPPSGCIRRPVRSRAGVPRQQRTVPFPDRLPVMVRNAPPTFAPGSRRPEIRQPRARPFPGPIGAGQDRY